MRCHTDWTTAALDLPAVAVDTGPFARRCFLEVLWNHDPAGDLWLVETDAALLPLVMGPDGLAFVGHPDLVDYRSPLGDEVASLVAELMGSLPPGTTYRFDSLPREAASVVAVGLEQAGVDAVPSRHAITATLAIPASFDDYLAGLSKKERHEIRRKLRRFSSRLGTPTLTTHQRADDAFGHFVAMHRASEGDKGRFMTEAMETRFAALLEGEGWRIDLLRTGDGAPAAAAFGWADRHGYYLYNSAYDAGLAPLSPGTVLLVSLIERLIATGCGLVDFLKGAERYKFRMGAGPRPLYTIEGVT